MYDMNRRRALVALAVLVVLVMVGSSFGGGQLGPHLAAAPSVRTPTGSQASPLGQAPASPVALSSPTAPVPTIVTPSSPSSPLTFSVPHQIPLAFGPHPSQPPCLAGSSLLPYSTTQNGSGGTGFWTLNPDESAQSPCTVTWWDPALGTNIGPFDDELHLTFSSSVVGSGSRWTVPIHLPAQGNDPANGGLQDFVNNIYAGMVVTGDSRSLYNESYLQVVFTPASSTGTFTSLTYNLSVSVLSFRVGSDTNGSCLPPFWGLNVSWNNLYACELEVLNGGQGVRLKTYVPEDQFYNITFNGAAKGGIMVYANDSTNSSNSGSIALTKANVGLNVTPMYSSSCEDLCYLNWSMPFGNGFGVGLAAISVADQSMNITNVQNTINPVEVGAARYFTSGGYTGEFSNISIESASGGCSGLQYTIDCGPLLSFQGTQYPYFQFNGTVIAIGSGQDYPWTTEDFNQYYQFESHGNPNDSVPFWLDELTNSSQAGFIGPDGPLTVTVRGQDFGTISSIELNYTQPGSSPGSVTMTRISGTASIGMYQATIPGAGTNNGLLSYYLLGTNHPGELLRLPQRSGTYFTVQRGPIPKFGVQIFTAPSTCGTVTLNGTVYTNHETALLSAGYYSASAAPCYPYLFKQWVPTGVAVNNTRSVPTTVEVKENGSLLVNWKYIRPLDSVGVQIATHDCGAVVLNGTTYTANTTALLLDSLKVTLSYASCAGNTFSGWVVTPSSNVTVLGGNPSTFLTLHGNGTIVLTFVPSPQALALVLQVSPTGLRGDSVPRRRLHEQPLPRGPGGRRLPDRPRPVRPLRSPQLDGDRGARHLRVGLGRLQPHRERPGDGQGDLLPPHRGPDRDAARATAGTSIGTARPTTTARLSSSRTNRRTRRSRTRARATTSPGSTPPEASRPGATPSASTARGSSRRSSTLGRPRTSSRSSPIRRIAARSPSAGSTTREASTRTSR